MNERPEVVTRRELAAPTSEQTAGIQRGEAFAHDHVWAGYAEFPGGASTGWHHHGDYATYGYITTGAMNVEFGPDGEALTVNEGDFVYIPPHLVHRETVHADGGAGVVIRTGGTGPTVINVEDPIEADGTGG